MKINTISISTPDYPLSLREIPNSPKILYLAGRLPDESRIRVSIVGTRRPTAYGKAVTEQLSEALALHGAVIVSGLALGIDSIAHQACLKAGGTTIAVLPGDLHHPYPRTNHGLAESIVHRGGALLSEYEYNPRPARWDFLKRNRLVSGLAHAVVVTEASLRSGTMSTVTHALEQGRDVYAVPGPITSPLSAGCNQLIAQGASPITNITDFAESIAPLNNASQETFAFTPAEQVIIDGLKQGVTDGEELLLFSRLEPSEFHQTMTLLEIRGTIHALGANQWRL